MKPVHYPSDLSKLRMSYIAMFENEIATHQAQWEILRNAHKSLKCHLPKSLKKILVASYDKLVRYYIYYMGLSKDERELIKSELEIIFCYNKWQPTIAGFFMNQSNGIEISTCHYCDMAYINVYEHDEAKDGLYWINHEKDEKKICEKLRISDKTSRRIIDGQPNWTIESFNNLGWRGKNKGMKFQRTFGKKSYNHFDLDHALDKASCPIVALSLFNFVPSCSVCNEKLKRSYLLEKDGNPIAHISPTCKSYNFEDNVMIMLLPTHSATLSWENQDNYRIAFVCKDSDYQCEIDLFRLQERYNYHKSKAFYWLKMKRKYTDAHISMMANSIKSEDFTEEKIKEDIFRLKEDNDYPKCFSKLKTDMLK